MDNAQHNIIFVTQNTPALGFSRLHDSYMSLDSAVGTVTGYGPDAQEVGVRVPVGSRILSPPHRPDRLWGSRNLLSNQYWGLFPRGKAAGAWSWPFPPVRDRGQENVDLHTHSPICLQGVVLNFLSRKTLPFTFTMIRNCRPTRTTRTCWSCCNYFSERRDRQVPDPARRHFFSSPFVGHFLRLQHSYNFHRVVHRHTGELSVNLTINFWAISERVHKQTNKYPILCMNTHKPETMFLISLWFAFFCVAVLRNSRYRSCD
jgi:hypothetical protein